MISKLFLPVYEQRLDYWKKGGLNHEGEYVSKDDK